MRHIIPVAVFVLLATPVAALAQLTASGGMPISTGLPGTGNADFYNSGPMGGYGNDIMGGKPYEASGINAVVSPGSTGRFPDGLDKYAARDGCINYPGQAHNSADCSRIISWDPSWVVPNKPLDQMTGAEENMVRSYNILNHKNAPTR